MVWTAVQYQASGTTSANDKRAPCLAKSLRRCGDPPQHVSRQIVGGMPFDRRKLPDIGEAALDLTLDFERQTYLDNKI